MKPYPIALCACLATGALATEASATPAVTLDHQCYSPREPVTETGTGFTPAGQVTGLLNLADAESLEVLGSLSSAPVTADAAGAFTRTLEAPPLLRSEDRTEMAIGTWTDAAAPATPAVVQWTLSGWDVQFGRTRGRVSRSTRMRIDTWGWTTAGTRLYVHWVRGSKQIRSTAVGDLAQPCGDLNKTLKMFPAKAKPGRWTIQISATPKLDEERDPWFGVKITLPRPRKSSPLRGASAGMVPVHATRHTVRR